MQKASYIVYNIEYMYEMGFQLSTMRRRAIMGNMESLYIKRNVLFLWQKRENLL
jgi:hypothetical protein